MKALDELKTSTLERKQKDIVKKIEKAHENGNYEKLDELNIQRNKIEVALESKKFL